MRSAVSGQNKSAGRGRPAPNRVCQVPQCRRGRDNDKVTAATGTLLSSPSRLLNVRFCHERTVGVRYRLHRDDYAELMCNGAAE